MSLFLNSCCCGHEWQHRISLHVSRSYCVNRFNDVVTDTSANLTAGLWSRRSLCSQFTECKDVRYNLAPAGSVAGSVCTCRAVFTGSVCIQLRLSGTHQKLQAFIFLQSLSISLSRVFMRQIKTLHETPKENPKCIA